MQATTSSSAVSLSPSFNSYSNTRLAEIAARVAEDFGSDDDELYGDDEFYFEKEEEEEDNSATQHADGEENSSEHVERESRHSVRREEEEEFEFAFATTRDSPISADEIFHNGQIRPVYPLFNRDLFLKNGKDNGVPEKAAPAVRLPLRKLFTEERESEMTMMTASSSSSEADELDGVAADTYCVWRPKEEQRCEKSSSAGSNLKKWTFKDLMNRSHSDGSKDSFVFLSNGGSGRKKRNEEKVKSSSAAAVYGVEKRRTSYLPYRQDLVGLFSNVNYGLSKN